jgi:hypothetical protein
MVTFGHVIPPFLNKRKKPHLPKHTEEKVALTCFSFNQDPAHLISLMFAVVLGFARLLVVLNSQVYQEWMSSCFFLWLLPGSLLQCYSLRVCRYG